MKTKKFLMTSLLVIGMFIAKAANGFPPELVLVSQPVLTYNANSVTVYYDVQNIGDYTYRGDIYIYLDPDDHYYYAKKYVRVCPGRIKRIALSIPAYRPNPSWVYTVMPYYEFGNELYSFTTFEYFEPLRFCWNGYRNEPWVVIHVGPRIRHYTRPNPYRFYYDGYYPVLPPPPGGYPPGYFAGMNPLNPMHHTYGYHHHTGGYPANYYPSHEIPGYNHNDGNAPATVVRPSGGNTSGSMSSRIDNTGTANRPNNNGSNTAGSMSSRVDNNSSGATTRSDNNSSSSGRTDNSSSGRTDNSSSGRSDSSSSSRTDSGSVSRPSGNSSTSSTTSRSDSSSSSRSDSGSVSRPSSNSSSGTSSRSGSSDSSSSGRSSSSNSSSNSGRSGSSNSSSSRSGSTPSRSR